MLRIATSPIEERPWHTAKPNPFARGSPIRGNNDDHRQWRKQGVVVGAAASKAQVLFKHEANAGSRNQAMAVRSTD